MSLTHEYCHVISGAIISIIKRSWLLNDDTLGKLCTAVCREQKEESEGGPRIEANSPIEFLSKALLNRRLNGKQVDDVLLGEIRHSLFKREDEIMTLVFDIVYFFRRDIKRHIEMYWSYWLGLPGIHADRSQLVDYIIRSCCAIATVRLDATGQSSASGLRPEELLTALEEILQSSNAFSAPAIEGVLRHIRDQGNRPRFENEIRGYLPLIVGTLAFLTFDDTREELWKGRDDRACERLNAWQRDLRIDYDVVKSQFNPLDLISLSIPGSDANEHTTTWLLTLLDMKCHAY